MATLTKTPGAQWALSAVFQFDIASADAMLNASGVLTNFKAAAGVFDVIPLPSGAQVVGGDIAVLVVSNDTGTATMSVGDSASAARYLGATSIKSAARTALVPTGFQGAGESIRLTLANQNGDATTGKVRTTVQFVLDGRVNENLKTT